MKSIPALKDKKLNRLWEKAEKSGLVEEELVALKQEFRHHQEKVDQYQSLVELAEAGRDANQGNFRPNIGHETRVAPLGR